MEKIVKSNPDFTKLEENIQELIDYAKSGGVTDDDLNKRLDYIYKVAITALYGEEFYTWVNSKFKYAAQQLSEYKEVIKELLPIVETFDWQNFNSHQAIIDRAKKLIEK